MTSETHTHKTNYAKQRHNFTTKEKSFHREPGWFGSFLPTSIKTMIENGILYSFKLFLSGIKSYWEINKRQKEHKEVCEVKYIQVQ